MEIEGRIVRKLNVQTGNSARGNWAKQEFIIEFQEGNFPAQACLNVWGEDKVKELEKHQVGDTVKVSFNINSREYNGRWYTDLRAWKIESAAGAPQRADGYAVSAGSYSAPTGAGSASAPAAPMPTAEDMPADAGFDDLPF